MLGKNLKDLIDQGYINQALSLKVVETGMTHSGIHKYITGKEAFTNAAPIMEGDQIIGVVSATRNLDDLVEMKEDVEEGRKDQLVLEMDSLKRLLNKPADFIAESKAMQGALAKANKAAPFDTTILITGDSGTGKEVIARYIHNNSLRKDQAFIRVNCASIPKDLFESELFGYEKGAFTGASQSGKVGMFELADKGTLLLDEIGELPLEMQAKLLRAIQEREIQRVGGKAPIPVDVRIIASTNRNLAGEVREGKFRDDLYYRINVFPIHLEPLKNRKEDIGPLISYFLAKLNHKYHTLTTIEKEALDVLMDYEYPGNVRELENIIEYMYVLSEDKIRLETIPGKVLTKVMISNKKKNNGETGTLDSLVDLYEKTIIEDILVYYKTIQDAAEVLGVHPSTLSRKMKKYNLSI